MYHCPSSTDMGFDTPKIMQAVKVQPHQVETATCTQRRIFSWWVLLLPAIFGADSDSCFSNAAGINRGGAIEMFRTPPMPVPELQPDMIAKPLTFNKLQMARFQCIPPHVIGAQVSLSADCADDLEYSVAVPVASLLPPRPSYLLNEIYGVPPPPSSPDREISHLSFKRIATSVIYSELFFMILPQL